MKILVIEIPEVAFPPVGGRRSIPHRINRVEIWDESNTILYVNDFVYRIIETEITLGDG